MAKSPATRSAPAAAPSAAPAPVAGSATTTVKAPAEKTNRRVLGGPALDRLIGHGASIVPLASKGKLHSTVTSQIGASLLASEMAARINPMVKGWDQFDRGYLVGPSASYSACAVNTGSKKAKAQPAFVYGRRNDDGSVILFTADGNVWDRPAKGEREQGVFDAALARVTEVLGG